jgi:hypothetical protein
MPDGSNESTLWVVQSWCGVDLLNAVICGHYLWEDALSNVSVAAILAAILPFVVMWVCLMVRVRVLCGLNNGGVALMY